MGINEARVEKFSRREETFEDLANEERTVDAAEAKFEL